ncbi:MAG: hypothetical protein BWY82_01752 [Verrucomicrobia bacterium ADurb.Bin474]|nr:MAG: hypothetical protein BWY82_01752 [Verrucomicrobia bacterium ADurb.Bin474]
MAACCPVIQTIDRFAQGCFVCDHLMGATLEGPDVGRKIGEDGIPFVRVGREEVTGVVAPVESEKRGFREGDGALFDHQSLCHGISSHADGGYRQLNGPVEARTRGQLHGNDSRRGSGCRGKMEPWNTFVSGDRPREVCGNCEGCRTTGVADGDHVPIQQLRGDWIIRDGDGVAEILTHTPSLRSEIGFPPGSGQAGGWIKDASLFVFDAQGPLQPCY